LILVELTKREQKDSIKTVRNFIENYLYIINQENKLVLLKLNRTQNYIMEIIEWLWKRKIPVRLIILKARKEGVSTLIEAVIFTKTILNRYVNSYVISYNEKTTLQIYKITDRYYRHLPPAMRPKTKYYTKYSFVFESLNPELSLESQIVVDTAKNEDILRGSTPDNIHLSETARMENLGKVLTSALDAVPEKSPNTLVVSESTAKGQGNRFHKSWLNAVEWEQFKKDWEKREYRDRPPFIRVFIPWYWDDRYSIESPEDFKLFDYDHEFYGNEVEAKKRFRLSNNQMYWRRRKIASDEIDYDLSKFMEEYPATPEEAFLAAGDTIFSKRQLQVLSTRVKEPIAVGDLRMMATVEDVYHYYKGNKPEITFDKEPRGKLKIWEFPKEYEEIDKDNIKIKEPVHYIVASDVSEGVEVIQGKVDNSVAQVWKRANPFKLVAEICGRIEPDILADLIYNLGFYYNVAWVGVERNTYGAATNSRLYKELSYPLLYFRIEIDEKTDKKTRKFGWYTGKIERPIMITDFAGLVRNGDIDIENAEMISEMKTFVRHADGKVKAESSAFDDRVITGMVAYQLHKLLPKVDWNFKAKKWRPQRGSVTGR